jgi:hypothetical protein
MTISLTDLIADIEAKIAAADSSTSTDELLKIIKAARAANTIQNVYDSSGVMPVDSASVGNVLMSASDNSLYVLDSASGSWSSIAGSGGEGGEGGGFTFQGSVSGYTIAGATHGLATKLNTIDKFSLATVANATDVGDISTTRIDVMSIGSSTNGYAVGGTQYPGGSRVNTIEKFPFASDANAAAYSGNSISGISAGATATDNINGYQFAGRTGPGANTDTIQKFNYAVEANATDVGDLILAGKYGGGHSSSTHGYMSGGQPTSAQIDKFPFSVDGNATDVGDRLIEIYNHSSHSSSTHGYLAAGQGTFGVSSNIQKFSFISDGNSTNVANLAYGGNYSYQTQGISSTDYGYIAGGGPAPEIGTTIARFAFASDDDAVDTTYDLTVGRYRSGNTQV